MGKEKPKKIFISYAHVDLRYAKKIYYDLKRYGLEIWFDKESLLPGQDWEKEIRKAIRECDYFIALLSDKCLSERGFVHSELKFSFEIIEKYFPSDTGIFIIPVRLDDCKPSDAYERLGRLHWIDVFPEREYKNGINKILKVINPIEVCLRSKPGSLDENEAKNLIKKNDFFDKYKNPEGKGLKKLYKITKIDNDNIIVFDEKTGLMWQQSGSSERKSIGDAKKYIDELNKKRFAGVNDWRLPTLEEAMSLVDPRGKDLFISSLFNSKQNWIWTADMVKGESLAARVVSFSNGYCYWDSVFNENYVRAVRSGQSAKSD